MNKRLSALTIAAAATFALPAVADETMTSNDVDFFYAEIEGGFVVARGGKVLAETFDNPASYRLKPGEPYVRAQVLDSNGRKAWTQPVFAK